MGIVNSGQECSLPNDLVFSGRDHVRAFWYQVLTTKRTSQRRTSTKRAGAFRGIFPCTSPSRIPNRPINRRGPSGAFLSAYEGTGNQPFELLPASTWNAFKRRTSLGSATFTVYLWMTMACTSGRRNSTVRKRKKVVSTAFRTNQAVSINAQPGRNSVPQVLSIMYCTPITTTRVKEERPAASAPESSMYRWTNASAAGRRCRYPVPKDITIGFPSAANGNWMVQIVEECEICSAAFQSNDQAGANQSGGSNDTKTSRATCSVSHEIANRRGCSPANSNSRSKRDRESRRLVAFCPNHSASSRLITVFRDQGVR